jgi:hypothetical protein
MTNLHHHQSISLGLLPVFHMRYRSRPLRIRAVSFLGPASPRYMIGCGDERHDRKPSFLSHGRTLRAGERVQQESCAAARLVAYRLDGWWQGLPVLLQRLRYKLGQSKQSTPSSQYLEETSCLPLPRHASPIARTAPVSTKKEIWNSDTANKPTTENSRTRFF